jgi:hypothetical protein
VDAKGVVRAITSLQDLTAADLESLIAGRVLQIPERSVPGCKPVARPGRVPWLISPENNRRTAFVVAFRWAEVANASG